MHNFTNPDWKAQGVENLITAKKILENLQVPYFLSNGTLLGCIRDNDLIPHDSDIDLGIFIEDYRPEILQAFSGAGFIVHGIFGTLENGYELSLRNKVKIDLFFYYHEGDKDTMSVWTHEQVKYVYPKIKLTEKQFLGEMFPIPENYEEYLTAQYGDWRTPVTEWDYATSPHNKQTN